MSTPVRQAQQNAATPAVAWILIAVGLLALFVPSILSLTRTIWASDQQGHGPIVLAIVGWLIWKNWPTAIQRPVSPRPVLGWALILLGLVAYVLGRSQDIATLEIGAAIPLLSGVVLLFRGAAMLRRFGFALFFLLFAIPLPGAFVDAVTLPMKIAVSHAAEALLGVFNYPISRSGVILQIGQYQLLVADACAGLNTLFTLEALGLLYLNLVKHQSMVRNVTLAILIIPISFTANVIRVCALTLITYHFGDAAGQGFLHGFAGMVLFLAALLLIMAMDGFLRALTSFGQGNPRQASVAQ